MRIRRRKLFVLSVWWGDEGKAHCLNWDLSFVIRHRLASEFADLESYEIILFVFEESEFFGVLVISEIWGVASWSRS